MPTNKLEIVFNSGSNLKLVVRTCSRLLQRYDDRLLVTVLLVVVTVILVKKRLTTQTIRDSYICCIYIFPRILLTKFIHQRVNKTVNTCCCCRLSIRIVESIIYQFNFLCCLSTILCPSQGYPTLLVPLARPIQILFPAIYISLFVHSAIYL